MPVSNLIIWRHAEAEMTAASGLDVDRALTAKGLADAHHLAKWLKKHLPKDTHIYCSPARRCRQTLDALLALNGKRKFNQVAYTKALALESDARAICQQLLNAPCSSVLLVGHQPLLGELVAHLLLEKNQQSVEVKKGAVWWLRHHEYREVSAMESMPQPFDIAGKMEILTVLHPKFLR